jgi:Flp pilus assembly pilin Flp
MLFLRTPTKYCFGAGANYHGVTAFVFVNGYLTTIDVCEIAVSTRFHVHAANSALAISFLKSFRSGKPFASTQETRIAIFDATHSSLPTPFLKKERSMSSLLKFGNRFVADEKAAEVTELGIVLALVVAGCVGVLAAIGPEIIAAYESLKAALGIT